LGIGFLQASGALRGRALGQNLRSAPVSLRAFLWIKFAIYLLPLLMLSETLIVASNLLLHVMPFMMILSTITIFFLTPGGVSVGVGISKNQTPMS
jgi:ABC-2 type transport system permease protein